MGCGGVGLSQDGEPLCAKAPSRRRGPAPGVGQDRPDVVAIPRSIVSRSARRRQSSPPRGDVQVLAHLERWRVGELVEKALQLRLNWAGSTPGRCTPVGPLPQTLDVLPLARVRRRH